MRNPRRPGIPGAGAALLRSVPAAIRVRMGARIPLRITHCITYRCNLDCAYCARHGGGGPELSTDQVHRLIRDFRRAGTRFWGFNGGEPLVRKDLGELMGAARRAGMLVSLATNGTLVAERIEEVREAHLVSVSLDGPRDVQEAVRPGSFDRIVTGLERLRREASALRLVTVVSRANLDRLDELLDLAETYGARVYFQPIRRQAEDQEGRSESWYPDPREMAAAMQHLLRARRAGRPVASCAAYLREIRDLWPAGRPRTRCWAGRLYGFLTPDGCITACCDTLTRAGETPGASAAERGAGAFRDVPDFHCPTCFSAIPLETNLLASCGPIQMIRRARGTG